MIDHGRTASRLTLDEVYRANDITGACLSADGTELAIVLQHANTVVRDPGPESPGEARAAFHPFVVSNVYLQSVEGGPPRPLLSNPFPAGIAATANIGEAISLGYRRRFVSWSRDHGDARRLAIYNQADQTLEIVQLNGQRKQILHQSLLMPGLEAGDADLAEPAWSPDSTSLLVTVRDGFEARLVEVAADGTSLMEILRVTGSITGWAWSADGDRVVMVTRDIDDKHGRIQIVDRRSREIHLVAEDDQFEYATPVARWSPAGDIVFRSNRSGRAKLWCFHPADSSTHPVTSGDWDEGAFHIGPDGQIAYSSRSGQDGTGDDLWICTAHGEDHRRVTRHHGVNAPLGWAGSDRLVYWHTSGVEPGDVWSAAIGDGATRRLTSTTPAELSSKVAEPEEVIVPCPWGEMTAMVYFPVHYRQGEKYPAIVWPHGGPPAFDRIDSDWRNVPYKRWLANEGFIVIGPNYRGGSGEGVAHMEAVAGDGLGKADLEDTVSAARYMATRPEVDLTRGVGIGGLSWGGYLTLMAMTNAPDVFSCGASLSGPADWWVQQAATELRAFDNWLLGGWVYEQPDRARDRSPISKVDRLKAPLLLIHGRAETNVPFSQIEAFAAAAAAAGKTIETAFYELEGHQNVIRANRQDALDRISSFFRMWLKPWDYTENPMVPPAFRKR